MVTISQAAQLTGVAEHTLRAWERRYGVFQPSRTPGGYRDYTTESLTRIDFIHRGQAAGLSLAQIRQVLDIRDHGQVPCDHVRDLLDARLTDIDLKLRQLHDLRDTLAGLRDQAEHVEPDTCSSDQVCRYL